MIILKKIKNKKKYYLKNILKLDRCYNTIHYHNILLSHLIFVGQNENKFYMINNS